MTWSRIDVSMCEQDFQLAVRQISPFSIVKAETARLMPSLGPFNEQASALPDPVGGRDAVSHAGGSRKDASIIPPGKVPRGHFLRTIMASGLLQNPLIASWNRPSPLNTTMASNSSTLSFSTISFACPPYSVTTIVYRVEYISGID